MRLIDADALTVAVEKIDYDIYGQFDEDGFSFDRVCKIIDDAPTVNPVKHGRWIANGSIYDAGIGPLFVCSECNADAVYRRNYCPTCGARMDGDNND